MSIEGLDRLFAPRSVALVGASPREDSLGRSIVRKIREGGFQGQLALVNPNHALIDDLPTAPHLAALNFIPDVVVIATPRESVPGLVQQAADIGAAAAVIITSGFSQNDPTAAELREIARRTSIRIVGPNCMGLIAPRAHFDASFAAKPALPGDLALISQSGAIATAILEWAHANRAGFSAALSLGDKLDVDFADCLDYFAQDRATRAILLYIEDLTDARKFMSAARAAARIKPVLVVKAGRGRKRHDTGLTHSSRLAAPDLVYEAAFRRAGLLRVYDLDELFAAAETLAHVTPFNGDRIGILTNGGGLGQLAVDRIVDLGGEIATLSDDTIAKLNARFGRDWSGTNPVDIRGDSGPEPHADAVAALLDDAGIDALLVMNSPTALASSKDIAIKITEIVRAYRSRSIRPKPVFADWAGQQTESEEIFAQARIPCYSTEADAVRGLMYLVRWRRAQDSLMELPARFLSEFVPDTKGARAIIDEALKEERRWLNPAEAAGVLECYGIRTAPVSVVAKPDDAGIAAEAMMTLGAPVALKIVSQDIIHKSEVGGVMLNLAGRHAVTDAARKMEQRVLAARPDAVIEGFAIQSMVPRDGGRELIAGLADDPLFGPVIVFGRGGTAVEIIDDKAIGLPPLDMKLADDLIARTRVSRTLGAYQGVPAANREEVARTLVKLAQMAVDLPELLDVDLNPLIADESGVIALDARMRVGRPLNGRKRGPNPRLAIKPYPKEWERSLTLKDGWKVDVRPVRPDDAPLYGPFFAAVTREDLRLRFFAPVKDFSDAFIAKLTHLDYSRAMAFAAIDHETGELLGVVRLHADADHREGEYAILLRSDLKGRGLGWALMKLIIDYARQDGLEAISGQILRENTTMIGMCEALGFEASADPNDPDLKVVTLDLNATSLARPAA